MDLLRQVWKFILIFIRSILRPKFTQVSKDDVRVGGHAIRIVGWGEESGVKFWWIANSWGTKWGINGYFRMIRGINDCKIEENVVCGLPDLFYPTTMIFPKTETRINRKYTPIY